MEYIHHGKDGMLYGSAVLHREICTNSSIEDIIDYMDTPNFKNAGDSPLVLADFGTGDGALALSVYRFVIDSLRQQDKKKEVIAILNDVADKDVGIMSRCIKESGLQEEKGMSVLMSVNDFFSPCSPISYVDVSMSHLALQYIGSVGIENELFITCSGVTDSERTKFMDNLRENWRIFLNARSQELKPNGRLIISFVMEGSFNNGRVFQVMSDVWRNMFTTGTITQTEFKNGTIGISLWSEEDVMSPFVDTVFSDLTVRSFKMKKTQGHWSETDQEGNPTAALYAEKVTDLLRAVTRVFMKEAFSESQDRSTTDIEELVDTFYQNVQVAIETDDNVVSEVLHVGQVFLQKMS